MTTLEQMIKIIQLENPNVLRVGDEVAGYTNLTATESQQFIEQWAANRLAKQNAKLADEAAKAAAQAKLAALGLTTDDLKALGLGGN